VDALARGGPGVAGHPSEDRRAEPVADGVEATGRATILGQPTRPRATAIKLKSLIL